MARFLVFVCPVPGHTLPTFTVARELARRGHEVAIATGRRFADAVARLPARFLPIPAETDFDHDEPEARFPGLQGLTGLAALKFVIREIFLAAIPAQVAALRPFVRAWRPDALVTDPSVGPVEALHELEGPPWAVFNMVPMSLSSRDTAPFGLGLLPDASPPGRLRNRMLKLLMDTLAVRDLATTISRLRRRLGMPPRRQMVVDVPGNAQLFLQTTVPSFEYPRSDLPPQVHFVGPVVPRVAGDAALPAWWPDVERARTVVLVSQGTFTTAPDQLLLPTLRALASEDLLVVATTGRPLDPALLGGAPPANARLAPFVPYHRLLPRVAAMVTNGGYGGVQTALLHGVPLVAAGDTEEKMEICNRIAWSGAGVNLRTHTPGAAQLRDALRAVLHEPAYRTAARRLRDECARFPGEGRAADLLEELARTGRPVHRGGPGPVAVVR